MLKQHIEMAGTASAWATKNSFNPTFVYAVLNGKSAPSERLLSAVGIKKVVTYEFI